MTAPVGDVVGLYFDGFAVIEEGDVVKTAATGRCYRIVSVRVQQRGLRQGRQHLKALVIDPSEVTGDDTVHSLHWYSRNRTVRS